jgi:hypothetical protein
MKAYEKATQKRNQTDKALFSLAWQLEELKNMCEECRLLRAELTVVVDLLNNPDTNLQSLNLPLRLSKLREKLLSVCIKIQTTGNDSRICFHDFCRETKPKALRTTGSMCAKQKP